MAKTRILGMRPLFAILLAGAVFLFWGKIKPLIVNIVSRLKGTGSPSVTPSTPISITSNE